MSSDPNYYAALPSLKELESAAWTPLEGKIPGINGHIHSPYSFSAFHNIEQPFQMAKEEGISVLGINDFYSTDGYGEFAALAKQFRIFPLFNIEFMALQKAEQQSGIRINDPVNPGRTYMSGKGLCYPVRLSDQSLQKLEILQQESNRQTYRMVDKLNDYLASLNTGIRFDAADIQRRLARNLLRERHIAAAVRLAVSEKYKTPEEIMKGFTLIFKGKTPKSSLENVASLENEIRNNLLKSGGPAYVPEDEKAFLSLSEVTVFILDAGGIPCYPVLLDDAKGNFTEFEKEWSKMADRLTELGIYMIELIPGRNDYSILKEFVHYFDKRGFPVTFGSEHNTPQLDPLTITCRGGALPDAGLQRINYRGVSVIAAHQYLTANGETGFPAGHFPSRSEKEKLEHLGMKIISEFTQA